MSEEKNLVGKKIDLKKLADEIDKNEKTLEVNMFVNVFYSVMNDLEENHPLVKETMKKLGDEYDAFMSSIMFMLMVRLSQLTLSKKEFYEMIDRTTEETIEMPSAKEMN